MSNATKSSGSGWILILLAAFIFSGLILSVWAFLAKRSGRSFGLQLFFGLICIGFFGYYVSYQFYTDYIPGDDKLVYYIGLIGTYANGLAAIVWLLTILVKPK